MSNLPPLPIMPCNVVSSSGSSRTPDPRRRSISTSFGSEVPPNQMTVATGQVDPMSNYNALCWSLGHSMQSLPAVQVTLEGNTSTLREHGECIKRIGEVLTNHDRDLKSAVARIDGQTADISRLRGTCNLLEKQAQVRSHVAESQIKTRVEELESKVVRLEAQVTELQKNDARRDKELSDLVDSRLRSQAITYKALVNSVTSKNEELTCLINDYQRMFQESERRIFERITAFEADVQQSLREKLSDVAVQFDGSLTIVSGDKSKQSDATRLPCGSAIAFPYRFRSKPEPSPSPTPSSPSTSIDELEQSTRDVEPVSRATRRAGDAAGSRQNDAQPSQADSTPQSNNDSDMEIESAPPGKDNADKTCPEERDSATRRASSTDSDLPLRLTRTPQDRSRHSSTESELTELSSSESGSGDEDQSDTIATGETRLCNSETEGGVSSLSSVGEDPATHEGCQAACGGERRTPEVVAQTAGEASDEARSRTSSQNHDAQSTPEASATTQGLQTPEIAAATTEARKAPEDVEAHSGAHLPERAPVLAIVRLVHPSSDPTKAGAAGTADPAGQQSARNTAGSQAPSPSDVAPQGAAKTSPTQAPTKAHIETSSCVDTAVQQALNPQGVPSPTNPTGGATSEPDARMTADETADAVHDSAKSTRERRSRSNSVEIVRVLMKAQTPRARQTQASNVKQEMVEAGAASLVTASTTKTLSGERSSRLPSTKDVQSMPRPVSSASLDSAAHSSVSPRTAGRGREPPAGEPADLSSRLRVAPSAGQDQVTPSQPNSAFGKFRPLVEAMLELGGRHSIAMNRGLIAKTLLDRDPDVFKRAGYARWTEYADAAQAVGLIKLFYTADAPEAGLTPAALALSARASPQNGVPSVSPPDEEAIGEQLFLSRLRIGGSGGRRHDVLVCSTLSCPRSFVSRRLAKELVESCSAGSAPACRIKHGGDDADDLFVSDLFLPYTNRNPANATLFDREEGGLAIPSVEFLIVESCQTMPGFNALGEDGIVVCKDVLDRALLLIRRIRRQDFGLVETTKEGLYTPLSRYCRLGSAPPSARLASVTVSPPQKRKRTDEDGAGSPSPSRDGAKRVGLERRIVTQSCEHPSLKSHAGFTFSDLNEEQQVECHSKTQALKDELAQRLRNRASQHGSERAVRSSAMYVEDQDGGARHSGPRPREHSIRGACGGFHKTPARPLSYASNGGHDTYKPSYDERDCHVSASADGRSRYRPGHAGAITLRSPPPPRRYDSYGSSQGGCHSGVRR